MKNNYLDKIKKQKYSKMSVKEKEKQQKYYKKFMKEVLKRKERGDEKYGNYVFEVGKEIAFKEFEEELQDSVAHIIALGYRFKYNKEVV